MRDTPLTDVRSLASSLLIHALALALVSLIAVQVVGPVSPTKPQIIHGELGPVDNRAPADEAGGGPGDPGGLGPPDALNIRSGTSPLDLGSHDDAIPSITEGTRPPELTPEMLGPLLPGLPISSGVGVDAGLGGGGGGGTGGGSGGGIGTGRGPGTVFFGVEEHAQSFAYVIDRSGSMSQHGALSLAKRELLASLTPLPPDARFTVIFYNLKPSPIADLDGREGLRAATAANKDLIRDRLNGIDAIGGTDHAAALRAVFAYKPEVVYFLTDGLLMSRETANQLRDEAGPARIHAIEFGIGPPPSIAGPLKGLAIATGGSYRYINILQYASPE